MEAWASGNDFEPHDKSAMSYELRMNNTVSRMSALDLIRVFTARRRKSFRIIDPLLEKCIGHRSISYKRL